MNSVHSLHSVYSLHSLHSNVLFKVYPYSLVKQVMLQALVGKVLQTEQAGGIAFVDGNFQVVCGIEECEFFSLGHVGIGLADPVDDFVSFENNPETPAPALRFKFVPGNVDDHIFKLINEYDLPFNIILTQQWPQ